MHFFCVAAMECEDTPEIGDNSGAAWYIWDDSKLYNKQISVVCPLGKDFIFSLFCMVIIMEIVGQAFDTIYNRTIDNQCGAHDPSSAEISWKYNENNTLPACIRKC